MPKIAFKIITPERVIYEDEIERLTVPTESGEITVLAKHAPLVSLLKPGEIRLKKDGNTIVMAVSTGFLEIRPNSQVYILADTAERAEDIDIKKVEEAKARAEQMLKEKQDRKDVDFAKLQAVLDRELARLRVVQKYRKRI